MGKKVGMTRVFNEDEVCLYLLQLLEVEPNRSCSSKNIDTDGYNAIQITTGGRKANRLKLTKPMAGHYAKAGVEAGG